MKHLTERGEINTQWRHHQLPTPRHAQFQAPFAERSEIKRQREREKGKGLGRKKGEEETGKRGRKEGEEGEDRR